MKTLNSFVVLLLCILLFGISSSAQEDSIKIEKDKIEAILKVKNGDIHLRWAPNTSGLWLKMQHGSLVIQRQSWEKGKFDPDLPLETISDTLRVWSQSDFEALSDTDQANEYLMLAGYCMHAPYESIREKGISLESIVNREEELTNRFSSALFAAERDALAAKSMAMSFKDEGVDLEKNHAYHIILITEEKKIFQSFAFYQMATNYDFTPQISKSSEEEGTIVLSWDKASHAKYYSAYWIERSENNRDFERLNSAPYVHAFDANLPSGNDDFIYVDSVKNYIPYYYRIIGLDAFGDDSKPSPSLKLMGRDKTPPPTIDHGQAEMHLDQYMKITWTDSNISEDLAGYYLKKSPIREGPFLSFSPLLSISDRSFQDYSPNYLSSNFYQVCKVDTAKNEACSYPIYGLIRDTIPPSKPEGLSGEIDSTGVVTLNWTTGKEVDLKGYNVYFANKWNRVFTVLNQKPILTNQFLDTVTLNSLTEEIYYRIVAIDVRDNLSVFSDMVQIIKPDTIPPGPSIFKNFQAINESIELKWAPSGSKDVESQKLMRATDNEAFILLKELDKNVSSYSDSNVEVGAFYTYQIIVTDDSGLTSQNISELRIKSPLQHEIPTMVLESETIDDGYVLNCNIKSSEPTTGKLIIYAAQNEGPFITWKSLEIVDSNIQLRLPSSGKTRYKARIHMDSGKKSDFSNVVVLN